MLELSVSLLVAELELLPLLGSASPEFCLIVGSTKLLPTLASSLLIKRGVLAELRLASF